MGLPRPNDGEARFSAYVEELISVIGPADRAKPLRERYSRCLLKLVKQAPLVELYAARSFLPTGWLSSSIC